MSVKLFMLQTYLGVLANNYSEILVQNLEKCRLFVYPWILKAGFVVLGSLSMITKSLHKKPLKILMVTNLTVDSFVPQKLLVLAITIVAVSEEAEAEEEEDVSIV